MKSGIFRAFCAVAVIAVCALGGCVRSIQPVLKDEQLISNDQMLGSWVGSDGTTRGVITAGDSAKVYKLAYTDKDGKTSDLLIRVGKVGDMMLAESTAAPLPGNEGDTYKLHLLPLYSFALVKQMTPTQIVIKVMQDGWFGEYVKAHPGELATIALDKDEMIISATTDDLQVFLIKHEKDEGAFGDDGVFVRPGDATTRPSAGTASKGTAGTSGTTGM